MKKRKQWRIVQKHLFQGHDSHEAERYAKEMKRQYPYCEVRRYRRWVKAACATFAVTAVVVRHELKRHE